MLLEEIKNINSTEKECRKFGLTVGIVLVILALLLFYFKYSGYMYFSIPGGLLVIFAIISPQVLRPVQKIWMALAVVMGYFMSRVILTILFYLIVTPIGLLAKLFRKDFLDLSIDKNRKSYWNIRESKEYSKIDTERQF